MPSLSNDAARVGKSVFAEMLPYVNERRSRGLDLIELQIGDSCLLPPKLPVMDHRTFRYGDVLGLSALRRAIGEWLSRKGRTHLTFNWEAELLIGAGGTHALFCAARAVLNPQDEVLVMAPYWPLTTGILAAVSAVPVEVPMTQNLYANPSLDIESALAPYLTDRTRAVYFISPNNPDGFTWSREQLGRLASFVKKHDLWVFADEVYADFVFDGGHVPFVTVDDVFDRTISAYSFSKSLALAGARVGVVTAPANVIAAARRVSTHTVFNVPEHEQRLVLSALDEIDAWQAAAHRSYAAARSAACEALSCANIPHYVPHGGTYVFVDLSATHSPTALKAALIRAIDRGVMVAPGEGFGAAFGSNARLCFTSEPTERVVKGIEHFVMAL